jgi:hypothetical protein
MPKQGYFPGFSFVHRVWYDENDKDTLLNAADSPNDNGNNNFGKPV